MNPALKAELDRVLVAGLRPQLTDAIDALLERGVSKRTLMLVVEENVRRATGGDPGRGRLVIAAVEAYLETR